MQNGFQVEASSNVSVFNIILLKANASKLFGSVVNNNECNPNFCNANFKFEVDIVCQNTLRSLIQDKEQ